MPCVIIQKTPRYPGLCTTQSLEGMDSNVSHITAKILQYFRDPSHPVLVTVVIGYDVQG